VLKRLVHDFNESLRFDQVMCGIAREFGDPGTLVGEALNAAACSEVPGSAELWARA
jgi:hypothetical protein